MSGPKEDLANGAEADAVPSGGSLIGTAESAEMEANVLRFDDDNRNAVILRGGESTKAVHGGERQKGGVKGYATLNALTTPIVQSSTFTFRNTAEILAFNESAESSEYGRYGNPTVRAAEEKILALENAEDCLVSASGMNAVTTKSPVTAPTFFAVTVATQPALALAGNVQAAEPLDTLTENDEKLRPCPNSKMGLRPR